MALAGIPISENECIGDSLQTINNALTSLDLLVSESGANVTVQDTPPSSPSAGDLWYDSSSGIMSVYYDSQWVDTGGGDAGPLINVENSDTINLTWNSSTNTLSADLAAGAGDGGGVPTGSVTYYSLSSAPTGWIECNGAALSASMGSSYTALRTLLINGGSPFGASGSDPRIPDLRGKFIRSNGSDGTYTSGTFGQTQADAFQGHYHTTNAQRYLDNTGFEANSTYGDGASHPSAAVTTATTDGTNGTPRTASETRPANLALLACIKL